MSKFYIYEEEVVQHVYLVEAKTMKEAIETHDQGRSEFCWSAGSGSEITHAEKEE